MIMLILPEVLLLSFGLFLLLGEPSKEEKDPEKELEESIAKYLAKTKGNRSES
jgi:hypothetical protein